MPIVYRHIKEAGDHRVTLATASPYTDHRYCTCGVEAVRMAPGGGPGPDPLWPGGGRPACGRCRQRAVYMGGLCGRCWRETGHEQGD